MSPRKICKLAPRIALSVGLIALALARVCPADARLAAVFSDHAVLQAGKPVEVWGWATPGEAIHVDIAGVSADATASSEGKWSARLAPLAKGGPHVLTVRGNNTLLVNDVLIGEVWLCAGQSNMEMQIRGLHGEVHDADAVIAEANHPSLRQFVQDKPYALNSTAVPPADPLPDRPGRWVVCAPDTAAKFTAIGYFFGRELQENLDTPVGLVCAAVGGTTIEAWTSLPAQQAVPDLRPLLADWRRRLSGYDPVAEKEAAAKAKAASRLARAAAAQTGAPEPKAPPEADFKNQALNGPAGLFNGVIAPLMPYTVRGALWYQGERNASGRFTSLYGRQLEVLIADWRSHWGENLYFEYVQIPNLKAAQSVPSDDKGWAVWVRDGQRATLAHVSNVAMAITIDLGGVEASFLHPRNKDAFAHRLAVQALNDVYQRPTAMRTGPLFRSVERVGRTLAVSFDFADGLHVAGNSGVLAGFAIAGADRNFVWAHAELRDGRVIVSSEQVAEPKAVRYGWASNPVGNLRNSGELPCSPFRSDDWPPSNVTLEEPAP